MEQENRIIEILQSIGMMEYINSLPHGIHTHIGRRLDDEGIIMSGGQLQKIAIARALFRNVKILLFDEPSSALDPIAEDEFFKTLQSVSLGKMVFYVSHRLSSAIFADEVIFIKDQVIYASGRHFDLLKACPECFDFYNAQAKYYQTESLNE